MAEKLQARVVQSNQHWQRLLDRVAAAHSRKTLRQIGFAFVERIVRRRPDELDVVCDTLKQILDKLEKQCDPPFSMPSENDVADKDKMLEWAKRQQKTQVCLVLGIFRDVAVSMDADARRESGMQLLNKLLEASNSRTVLNEIGLHGKRTNGDLQEVLGVSESRVSQILRPLRKAGLILFKKEGQRRLYSLTENGFDQAKRVLGIDYRPDPSGEKSDFGDLARQYVHKTRDEGLAHDEAVQLIIEELGRSRSDQEEPAESEVLAPV